MKLFLSLLMLAILVAAGAATYGVHLYRAPNTLDVSVPFTVAKGAGLRTIAANLEQEKLISNKWIFLLAMRFDKDHSTLKAGEYEIEPHATMSGIMAQLSEGRVIQRKVTIREGLTSFEIIALLNEAPNLTGEIKTIPAEGTLLPETYLYTKDQPREEILAQMQRAMAGVKEKLWANRAKDLPFTTWEQAVTLASIVEKETGVASERKTIAGVFENRLKRGIPLQSDPTVIYALTDGKPRNDGQGPLGRRLLLKDLKIDSPFNTYKNAGLPPSPIANPGRDAIEAVLHPEDNDYIYFVADGTGGHVFAKTLREHNNNVAKWRKIRRSQSK